jgi:hypothetical protein
MLSQAVSASAIGANPRTIITVINPATSTIIYTVPANKKFIGTIFVQQTASYAQYIDIQANGSGNFITTDISNYSTGQTQTRNITLTAGTVVRTSSNINGNYWNIIGVESDA